jgi:hypothetical protein
MPNRPKKRSKLSEAALRELLVQGFAASGARDLDDAIAVALILYEGVRNTYPRVEVDLLVRVTTAVALVHVGIEGLLEKGLIERLGRAGTLPAFWPEQLEALNLLERANRGSRRSRRTPLS